MSGRHKETSQQRPVYSILTNCQSTLRIILIQFLNIPLSVPLLQTSKWSHNFYFNIPKTESSHDSILLKYDLDIATLFQNVPTAHKTKPQPTELNITFLLVIHLDSSCTIIHTLHYLYIFFCSWNRSMQFPPNVQCFFIVYLVLSS